MKRKLSDLIQLFFQRLRPKEPPEIMDLPGPANEVRQVFQERAFYRIRRQRWFRLVVGISAVVVFCTTYALILPAITIEADTFNRISGSHVHTPECYQKVLTCGRSEGPQEVMTTYADNGELVQTTATHYHSEECYSEILVCGLVDGQPEPRDYAPPQVGENLPSAALPESTPEAAETPEAQPADSGEAAQEGAANGAETVITPDPVQESTPAEEGTPASEPAPAEEDSAAPETTPAGETTPAQEPTGGERSESDTLTSPTESDSPGKLVAQGADYTVTITYDDDAGIPAGAVLDAKEILQESEDYSGYAEQVAQALTPEGKEAPAIQTVRLFDISILAEGAPVQLKAPVRMEIRYANQQELAESGSVSAVHFGKEGPEVLDVTLQGNAAIAPLGGDISLEDYMAQTGGQSSLAKRAAAKVTDKVTAENLGGVIIQAEAFSVYAIVGHDEIPEDYDLSQRFETDNLIITAHYNDKAKLPENAKFIVTELDYNTYPDKVNAHHAQVEEKYGKDKVTPLHVVNMGFWPTQAGENGSYTVTGAEIEPAHAVLLTVKFKNWQAHYPGEDISVFHFPDEGGVELVSMGSLNKENSVSFQADSFSDFELVGGRVVYTPPTIDTSPGSGISVGLSKETIGNGLPYGTVYIDYDSMDMQKFPNIPAYPTTSPGTTANPVNLSSEQCLSYTGTNTDNPDVKMTVTIHNSDFTLARKNAGTENQETGIHYMPKPNDPTRNNSTTTNVAGGRVARVIKGGEVIEHTGKVATIYYTNVCFLSDGSVADLEVTISNTWVKNSVLPTKDASGQITNDRCSHLDHFIYSGNRICASASQSGSGTWGVNAARVVGAFDLELKPTVPAGSSADLTGRSFLFGIQDYDIWSRVMMRDLFWIDYQNASGTRTATSAAYNNADLIGRKMNDTFSGDQQESNLYIPAYTGDILKDNNGITVDLFKQTGSTTAYAEDGDRYRIDTWNPGAGGSIRNKNGSTIKVPFRNPTGTQTATTNAVAHIFFSLPITDENERIPLYDRSGNSNARYYFTMDPDSDQFKTTTDARLTTNPNEAWTNPATGQKQWAYPLYKTAVYDNHTATFLFWLLSLDEYIAESAILEEYADDGVTKRILSDIMLTDEYRLYVNGTTILPVGSDNSTEEDIAAGVKDGTLDSGYLALFDATTGVKFRTRCTGAAHSVLTESGMFYRITSKTYGGGEISTSDTDLHGHQTAYEVKTPSALGMDASSRAILAVARGKICTYTMTPETFYHAKRIQIGSARATDENDTNTTFTNSTSTGSVGSAATGPGASMVNFILDQDFDKRYQNYDSTSITGWTTDTTPAVDRFGNSYYRQSTTITDPDTGRTVTVYRGKMETINVVYDSGTPQTPFDVNTIKDSQWVAESAVDAAGNTYTRYTYEITDPTTGAHLGTVTRDKEDKIFYKHPDNNYLYCPDSSDGSAIYAMDGWISTAASGGSVTAAKEITYYLSRDNAGTFTYVFEKNTDNDRNNGVMHDWWITVWWEPDPPVEAVQIEKIWEDDNNAYRSRPEPTTAPVAYVTREDGCKFAVIPPTEDVYPAASAVSSYLPADRSAWSEPIDGYQYYTVPIHGWIIRRQAGDTSNATAAFYSPAANLPAASANVWTGSNGQTVQVDEVNNTPIYEYYYLEDLDGQGPDQGWGFVYKKDRNGLVSYEGKIQGVTLVDPEPQGSAEWIPDGLDRWRYTFEVNAIDYSVGNGYPNGETVTYMDGTSEDNQSGQYFRITEEAVLDYHGDYADMHWNDATKRWVLHGGEDTDNDGYNNTVTINPDDPNEKTIDTSLKAQYLDLLTHIEQVKPGANGVYDDFANVTGHNNHVNIPAVLRAMGDNYDLNDSTTGLYFERDSAIENGVEYDIIIFDDEEIAPDVTIPGHIGNPSGSGYLVKVWLDPSGNEYRRVFTAPTSGMTQQKARYTMDILALKENPRDTSAFMVDHGSQSAEFVIIQDENGVVNYVHPTKGFRVEKDPSGDIRYYAWREAKTLVSRPDGTKEYENGVFENGQWVREADELLFFTHYASTNSNMYRGEITNVLQRGDLEFYKTDQYGNPLEGAEFTLFNTPPCEEHHHQDRDRAGYWAYVDNGSVTTREYVEYPSAVSDENGLVSFTGINAGVYYMMETRVPTYKNAEGQDIPFDPILVNDPDKPDKQVVQVYRVTIHEVDGTSTIEPVVVSVDTNGDHTVRDLYERDDEGNLIYDRDGLFTLAGLLRPMYETNGAPIMPDYQRDSKGKLLLDEYGDPIPILPIIPGEPLHLRDQYGDIVLGTQRRAIDVLFAYDRVDDSFVTVDGIRHYTGKVNTVWKDENGNEVDAGTDGALEYPLYPQTAAGKEYYLIDRNGVPMVDALGNPLAIPTTYVIENDRPDGELIVEKEFDGNADKIRAEFPFRVKLEKPVFDQNGDPVMEPLKDENGDIVKDENNDPVMVNTYEPLANYGVKTIFTESVRTDENGQMTVYAHEGERIIRDLTQASYADENGVLVYKLTGGHDKGVTFTGLEPGAMVTVTPDASVAGKYTMTFYKDAAGAQLMTNATVGRITRSILRTDANGYITEIETPEDAMRVALRHGETFAIDNLPDGCRYTVEEDIRGTYELPAVGNTPAQTVTEEFVFIEATLETDPVYQRDPGANATDAEKDAADLSKTTDFSFTPTDYTAAESDERFTPRYLATATGKIVLAEEEGFDSRNTTPIYDTNNPHTITVVRTQNVQVLDTEGNPVLDGSGNEIWQDVPVLDENDQPIYDTYTYYDIIGYETVPVSTGFYQVDETDYHVTFTNKEPLDITIWKTDLEDKSLTGAEFTLYKWDPTKPKTETDPDTGIQTTVLGDWVQMYVTEKLTEENEPTGVFIVKSFPTPPAKPDNMSQSDYDALVRQQALITVNTFTEDNVTHDGQIKLSGLLQGTYKLEEKKAPESYVNWIDNTYFTLTYTAADAMITRTNENLEEPMLGVTLWKNMPEGQTAPSLSGVTFSLARWDPDQNTYVSMGNDLSGFEVDDSGEYGKFTLPQNLLTGKYRLTEDSGNPVWQAVTYLELDYSGEYPTLTISVPQGETNSVEGSFVTPVPPPANPYSKTQKENPDKITDPLLLQVQNIFATALPETGGLGTAAFYIIGTAFTIAAAAGLIVRKRSHQSSRRR